MTYRRSYGIVTLLTLCVSCALRAQTTAPATTAATSPGSAGLYQNPDPSRYLFENVIKPGMKGYGLTVMRGTQIEKFNFEVVDVVQNLTPGQNAIMVRCSGLDLEHTGIIAGMSGSPCFIDGKMIGAIAFGWPLSKDPIGGVQPIRQMLNVRPSATPLAIRSATRWAQGSHDPMVLAANAKPAWRMLAAHLAGNDQSANDQPSSALTQPITDQPLAANGMSRLSTPLITSTLSSGSMALLQQSLRGTGLIPLSGGAASSGTTAGASSLGGAADINQDELKLAPGSAIAIPILTGDMDMSAVGTVTEVRDNKVYAFGHAMLADGATRLPMATSYIYTVMPNLAQSFKMGGSVKTVGTLVTDENTAILGLTGDKPPTIPVTIRVRHTDGSIDRTYHYALTPHPRLTPAVAAIALTETLTSQRQLPKQSTIRLAGALKFSGATIAIDSLFTADSLNLDNYMLPLAMLTDNPYRNLNLESIDVAATVEPANKSVQIQSIVVPKTMMMPGDTIQILVDLEQYQGKTTQVTMKLKVPDDTPDGDYMLCVGSAMMMMGNESTYFPQRYQPENIESLTGALQRLVSYRQDRLYAMLVTDVHGIARRGREMPNLPGSRINLFASAKRRDSVPLYNETRTELPIDGVLAENGDMFTITVSRDVNKRYGKGGPSGAGSSAPAGMPPAPTQPRNQGFGE